MITMLRRLTAVALVVSLLMLAACGGDDGADQTADPETTASGSSDTPSATGSSSASPPTAAPDELTSAGTVLELGETANVKYEDDGVVAITPLSVEKAPAADMGGQLSAGETGWYVWLQVEIISETANGDIQLSGPGINTLARAAGSLALPLSYTDQTTCRYPFKPATPGPGDSWKTCNPVKLPKGQRPDEVIYTDLGTPYSMVDGEPVVWRLGT